MYKSRCRSDSSSNRRCMPCCTCPCRSPQKLSFSSLTKCWNCSVIGVTFAMGVSLLSRMASACEAKSQLTPSRLLHNCSYVTRLNFVSQQNCTHRPIMACTLYRTPGGSMSSASDPVAIRLPRTYDVVLLQRELQTLQEVRRAPQPGPYPTMWGICLTLLIGVGILRIVSTYHVFNHTIDEGAHVACGIEWLE